MFMKKIGIYILLLIFSLNSEAAWKMRSAYKPVPGKEVDRSVLYFTSGNITKIYVPKTLPYGMVESEKMITADGEFFLTTWSNGNQTVHYRVFSMSSETVEPVCSFDSYSETTKLKIKENVLLIKIKESQRQLRSKWIECAKIKKS